jgi:hypothetical protein
MSKIDETLLLSDAEIEGIQAKAIRDGLGVR